MFKKLAVTALGGCLLVAVLCLGLLPVTALAADGIELYIAGQLITESGCYANQDGTWTKVDGTEPASGQFYYDADTFTLTLNQAEITHDQTVTVAEGYTYDGSVIAFSQTADVSLKIVVSQGTSTITGTGGIRVESTTGNASLSIKGSGSLDVEPKGSNSGITLCSSKNTNLDIDGADVTASSPAQYGVYLISSTDASSTSTITVNNGSLTTGGNGNVGIYYYWSGTSNAGTSSLTVSGNAVVDTRNSQIMAQNKETVVQVGAGSDGNGGIVFNGKNGTVYGKVELQDDLEIKSGETLIIQDGTSLNCNGKLINNGTISVESGGRLEGMPTGIGSVKTAPTITTENLANGEVGAAYSQALEATGDAPIKWSSSDLPTWLTLDSNTGVISGTPTAEGTSTFTVTAANGNGSHSKEFTLVVEKPAFVPATGMRLSKESLTLQENSSDTLTAMVEPADATNKAVTWESSDTDIATVSEDGTVTAVSAGRATITATAADGSGASASCEVTVMHGDMVQTPKKDATCTAYGTEGYWTCGICGKHYKDEDGTVPTTPEESVIPATGHEFEGGLCSVCGARDTSFSPALVSGDGAKWTKGSSKGLTFVSSAAFADLVEVRLDGRVLSASEYVVREGSTIVTLPAKLLEGLKAGDHELLIVSGSGTVRASLTVAEAAKVEEAAKTEKASADELPANGDSTAPALAVAAAAAAGAGLVLLSRRRAAR